MLKILVIEDSAVHQEAARRQLTGYDLTIVGTCKEAQQQLKAEWDVVLTDMMIPWDDGLKEMSLGMSLVMLSLKNGVKHVALVTDADHHQDMNSKALDCLNEYDFTDKSSVKKTYFILGDSKVYVTNGGRRVADATTLQILSSAELYSEEGKVRYPWTGGLNTGTFENTTSVKPWAETLEVLTK